MSLLFMMPQWESATEVWMHRMISCLAEDIGALAVNDSCGNTLWQSRLPVISLVPPDRQIRYFSSLARKLGYTFNRNFGTQQSIISKGIDEFGISKILCQYGGFAVKLMPLWYKFGLPLFVHFHGYDVFPDLRQPDQPERFVHPEDYINSLKKLEKRAVFIAGSQFLKSQLVENGISSENITVKYYGVPLPKASHIHQKRKEIQILHLGRLVDFKSPDRTIKAFEIARSKGLEARLVMIGNGPLKPLCELMRLRSPYKESITIRNPITAEEAQSLYLETDIFTQHNITGEITRQAEGFGVSIVEAMASGLPVVGTKSGGVVETVVHGVTGFLNEPGDIEAQAQAFLELAANPDLRQQMGDASRKRVAECFSPQQETGKLWEILGLKI